MRTKQRSLHSKPHFNLKNPYPIDKPPDPRGERAASPAAFTGRSEEMYLRPRQRFQSLDDIRSKTVQSDSIGAIENEEL